MLNKTVQLEYASTTNHLVLVEFYGRSSAHYEWLESAVEKYAKQHAKTIEVVKVNAEVDRALAELHHVNTAPAFLLLLRGRELWRQVGELTISELYEMLSEF